MGDVELHAVSLKSTGLSGTSDGPITHSVTWPLHHLKHINPLSCTDTASVDTFH